MRLILALFLILIACAIISVYQHQPFPLLVDKAEARTIICNPQPTPELIGWHKKKASQT